MIRERLSRQEYFHLRRVGRAAWSQMRGIDPAVLVIQEEECVLVFLRELRAVAECVSGR